MVEGRRDRLTESAGVGVPRAQRPPRSSIPLVAASSTTPVRSGSSSQDAAWGRPSGPVTTTGIRRAPGTTAANA